MSIYDKYCEICRQATRHNGIFKTFKSYYDYRVVLEHVNYETGLEYIRVIKRDNPQLLSKIREFAVNDKIGSPVRFYFEELGMELSPTTLRYIKVLSDLILQFGSLDGMKIVEIGGGYGGQCLIISLMFKPKSYTIFDLADASGLQRKYLNFHGVENVLFKTPDKLAGQYDLCISNYAFSEFSRTFQDLYAENVIANSRCGYMTCNIFGDGSADSPLDVHSLINLKENHDLIKEEPLTGENNFIYVWHPSYIDQISDIVCNIQHKDRVCIQIGINDGKDEFNKIVRKTNPDKVILVEPNKSLNNLIYANYANVNNVILENIAITEEGKGIVELYLPQAWSLDGSTGGHRHDGGFSLLPRDDWGSDWHVLSAQSISFNNLCAKHSVNNIAFLQIDTEGYDTEIIKSIDFLRINIEVIRFERWNFGEDYFKRFGDKAKLYGFNGIECAVNVLKLLNYEIIDDGVDITAIKHHE